MYFQRKRNWQLLILQLDGFISDCCLRPASHFIYFLIVWNPNFTAALVLLSSAIFIKKDSMSSNWSGLRRDEWVSREFSVKWEFVDWCPLSFPFLEAQMTCPQQNHGPKCSSPSYKISPFSFISSWQSYQQSQQIKSRLKQQYLFFFSSRVANFFFLSSLCCTLPKRYVLSTSVESAEWTGCAESFYRSTVKWKRRKLMLLLQKSGQTADNGGFTSTLQWEETETGWLITLLIQKFMQWWFSKTYSNYL